MLQKYERWHNVEMMTIIKLVTILIVGFSLGFFLGLVFLDPGVKRISSHLEKSSPDSSNCNLDQEQQSYETWLSNQGARKVAVNFDEYLHGHTQKRVTLESEWLRNRVDITCVIFVEREKNVQAALLTWIKHCNSYLLFHAKKPHDFRDRFTPAISVVNFESSSSWHFLCDVVRYIWLKRRLIQWVLFVNDDMYVVPENLRYMVASFDFNEPYYLGHATSLWGQSYNLASSGYVLSKGAVSILATKFNTSESCQRGGKYWKKEDFYLGQNLRKLNVFPKDTRDALCMARFHGYNLNQLLLKNKLASIAPYWRNSLFPISQGKNCCSNSSVAFQGIEADKIFMYDYLINRLNIYTQGVHGNIPAPTPYPPEKVWQKFLVDQGFTHVENATAEEYFNAWKIKISQDINRGKFKNKKSKLRTSHPSGEDGHGEVYAVPFEIDGLLDTEN